MAAGHLPITTLHLDRTTANYEIKMMYPRTGNAAIDRQVAEWVKAQADWFAAGAVDKRPQDTRHSLDVSYAVLRNDRKMFETLFQFDSYTGGAHPNHALYTLNFMLPDGARVYLAEIVGVTAGMARVSELARKNLMAELVESTDPVTNADQVISGTEMRPGNFETFTISDDTLTLYFSEYEVAAYAAGPQKTEIPLRELRGVIRKDWRAAQPSFDCDSATTPIEHALCSDVMLARVDRLVAEAYSWQLQLADGEAAKTRARNAQRAFLTQRDAACAAQTGTTLTLCLLGAYQRRLTILKMQPH